MKKTILLAIIFFCLFSFSTAREIYKHTIDIQISEQGKGKIIEKYFLHFSNQLELEQFRNECTRLGPSLDAWNVFDENIFAHIGKHNEVIMGAIVSFEEQEEGKFVKLEYSLSEPLFEISKDSLRETEWKFNERKFDKLEVGGTIVIPKNMTITITIPSDAEIIGTITPQPIISGKTIMWQGFLNINQINLTYVIKKPIAPPIDTAKLLWDLIHSVYIWIIAIILLIACGIIYWKKEKIEEKIENFLVEHSKFEAEEEKEEIEIKFE